jgi:hypothetical protein
MSNVVEYIYSETIFEILSPQTCKYHKNILLCCKLICKEMTFRYMCLSMEEYDE